MKKIDFLKRPMNDIELAEIFVEMFEDMLIFVQDIGSWYIWNGKHWEKDSKDGGKRYEFVKQMFKYCNKKISDEYYNKGSMEEANFKQLSKWYGKISTRNKRDTILKDATSINPKTSGMFDKDKLLFNCQNGTYDFRTGKIRCHNKNDYITNISNVVFENKADAPKFKKYLEEVMCNDKEKENYLMQIMAYCLTGKTDEECFFVLYGGNTRNGKGTFVETMTQLMGTYAGVLPPVILNRKNSNGGTTSPPATPEIAKLKSTRVAMVSEIQDGAMLDVSLIKQISGNDKLSARNLYEGSIDFYPMFKIMINTNFLPKMTDDTIFRSDRLHLVEFTRHFEEVERNKGLKEELKKELSGIFNLLCKHYFEYVKKGGFTIPSSTKDLLKEYQLNSNKVNLFVEECLYRDKGAKEKALNVFLRYKNWCIESEYKAKGKKNFKEEMQKLGAVYPNKTDTYYMQGFSLRPISYEDMSNYNSY